MTALLHQLDGGRQIPLDRAVVLIGRSAECDAVVECSAKISRIHCAVVQVDRDYYLRDLGSMNGVWVSGQKVLREQRLQNGMEICIGDVRFLFLENVAVIPPVKVPAAVRSAVPNAVAGAEGVSRSLRDQDQTVRSGQVADQRPGVLPRISVDADDYTVLEPAARAELDSSEEPLDLDLELDIDPDSDPGGEVDVEVIEDP